MNDAFGILGMIFGMSAFAQLIDLKKEFEQLKENLHQSGAVMEQEQSD